MKHMMHLKNLIQAFPKLMSLFSNFEITIYFKINKNMRVQDVYKIMDSSVEGFFYKRSYNLVNFNHLLQILSEQKNLDQAMRVLKKMQVKKIQFL